MKVISCEFNIDIACVELRLEDGTMIAIDTITVENEVAENMYQRSELDWQIYNKPLEYADIILNGNPAKYLKPVTVNKLFENQVKNAAYRIHSSWQCFNCELHQID